MERGQMSEILKEQGFQKSGACNEKSCIIEVGQLLGVQRVLAGTVGKVGSTYEISISLIDVATGEMLFATTEDCRCSIDEVLLTSTSNIVKKILQRSSPASSTLERAKTTKSAPSSTGQRKLAPLWIKIATGALAVCSGIGGYYLDTRVQNKVQSNGSAYALYARNPTHAAYLSYQSQYGANCNAANQYGTFRNILYGIAGLSCVGFAVTFIF
jgi:hypothetical protein